MPNRQTSIPVGKTGHQKRKSKTIRVSDMWVGIDAAQRCLRASCGHIAYDHTLHVTPNGRITKVECVVGCPCTSWIDDSSVYVR